MSCRLKIICSASFRPSWACLSLRRKRRKPSPHGHTQSRISMDLAIADLICCRRFGHRFIRAFRSRRRWARVQLTRPAGSSPHMTASRSMHFIRRPAAAGLRTLKIFLIRPNRIFAASNVRSKRIAISNRFTIKTVRPAARLREEGNLELVRLMSLLAVNGFQLSTAEMNDDWFESAPNESELSNWLNQIAAKFGKSFPNVTKESAKPVELSRILVGLIYPPGYSDTLFSDSDVSYQLSFDDAAEIPKERRADIAALLRDGYFTLHPDMTLKPQKAFSRAQMLRLIEQIFEKKKWMPQLQTGTANPTADGKLVLKSGKTSRTIAVRPDVFLVSAIWRHDVSSPRSDRHRRRIG